MFTIYQITNQVNRKSYVGITIKYDPNKRFNEHVADANRGSKLYLHRSILKYGREKFSFKILEVGENHDYGYKIAEPLYIVWLKPEYNTCKGGEGAPGRVWTEESKLKSSMTQRGRKLTEEHRRALCVPKKNLIRKEKLPKRTKEESNKLRSESHKKFLANNPLELLRVRTTQKGMKKPTIMCPHCMRSGGIGSMNRWHFNRCRKRVV